MELTTAEISAIAKVSEDGQALLTDGLSPSRFITLLSEKKLFQDAILFLAHGLPVQLAIKWACACTAELQSPEHKAKSEASLEAAAGWVKSPSDEARLKAKTATDRNGVSTPADCVAMAVFFSGGSIGSPQGPPVPPPEHAAQKLAAAGILLAVKSHIPEKANDRFARALDIGRDLVKAKPG